MVKSCQFLDHETTARVQSLLTQFSGSDYAKFILPLKQLLAMARRDTSEVNRSIYSMQSNGFSSDQLRIAKAMREAFLRVKPREVVSKKGLPQQEGENRWHFTTDELLAQTTLRCYPNPFNPLTTIEVRLPVATRVELKICNMLGMEIHSLVDANFTIGSFMVPFKASALLPA